MKNSFRMVVCFPLFYAHKRATQYIQRNRTHTLKAPDEKRTKTKRTQSLKTSLNVILKLKNKIFSNTPESKKPLPK